MPLGDGAPLRAAITAIHAGCNTHLHVDWREGAETLTDVAGTGLKRVILLSDGQANEGLTDATAIVAQCAEWTACGVTTSTYGLGNSFNEELMVAMARAGGGNHDDGDTAEDLMEPFQQELELLGNLCLRDLRLSAAVPDGVEMQMVNDLPAVEGGWRLPDLAWGAEAWAVLRLKVPAGPLSPLSLLLSVLRVSVEASKVRRSRWSRRGWRCQCCRPRRSTSSRRTRVSAAGRAGRGGCTVTHAHGGGPWRLGGGGFPNAQANPAAIQPDCWPAAQSKICIEKGDPQPGPEFDFKMARLERLLLPAVLAGDCNVVPNEQDIYSPAISIANALLQPAERNAHSRLLGQGWLDAWRRASPDEPMFSFWDYP